MPVIEHGHTKIALDVRVDCMKFAENTRQRTLNREAEEIERIITAALAGRGYFDVDVVASADA